jgi:alpha-tubulin suppressor-like RCC1 family protein
MQDYHGFAVVGKVYTLGRGEYGRLGHGDANEEKRAPSVLQDLPSCTQVAAGQAVSYAVSQSGKGYRGLILKKIQPGKQWLRNRKTQILVL